MKAKRYSKVCYFVWHNIYLEETLLYDCMYNYMNVILFVKKKKKNWKVFFFFFFNPEINFLQLHIHLIPMYVLISKYIFNKQKTQCNVALSYKITLTLFYTFFYSRAFLWYKNLVDPKYSIPITATMVKNINLSFNNVAQYYFNITMGHFRLQLQITFFSNCGTMLIEAAVMARVEVVRRWTWGQSSTEYSGCLVRR